MSWHNILAICVNFACMKKVQFIFASVILVSTLTACSGNDGSSESNTTTATSTTTDSSSANASTNNTMTTNNGADTRTPLTGPDSLFVMKAAAGGLMEVEAGNIAQQNGQSDRVKAFGSMMVNDHGAANQELMSLAQGRGVTLPTALPSDMQQHMEGMRKMKGKAFDNHYMDMMLKDHKKDIADFEKQANSGNDPDLKAWAAKTLPTLKAHLDSAQAINKGMK